MEKKKHMPNYEISTYGGTDSRTSVSKEYLYLFRYRFGKNTWRLLS